MMNFRENMASLKLAADDYYYGRISYEEYRARRSKILSLLDEELNGVVVNYENDKTKENLIDRAIAFFKN